MTYDVLRNALSSALAAHFATQLSVSEESTRVSVSVQLARLVPKSLSSIDRHVCQPTSPSVSPCTFASRPHPQTVAVKRLLQSSYGAPDLT